MESTMKLPDDIFRQELLPYLTVDDIVKLDNACLNHEYRPQLLDKINGLILTGYDDIFMEALLFKWLGLRRIYFIEMILILNDDSLFLSCIENNYVNQFRYTKHIVMSGRIRDNIAIFIMSHCSSLLSIYISGHSPDSQVTDETMLSIAEHCTGIQSLSLNNCKQITDIGLVTISEHCSNLTSLKVFGSSITDASIISISTHCTGLQSLNVGCHLHHQITNASIISISTHCPGLRSLVLSGCYRITDRSIMSISTHCTGLQSLNIDCDKTTDASIISISTHCTGLESLHLEDCDLITDASIISLSIHCTGLLSLHLQGSDQITDVSIISISSHCTGLKSLHLEFCNLITDASIISISENCTGLEELFVADTDITDVSLIAIAKNCTGLQYLNTDGCDGLSSDELLDDFDSVFELRAVLLSIYPSLLI